MKWLALLLVLLSGCAKYQITYIFEEDTPGNYIVEWQTPYGYVYQHADESTRGRQVYCVGDTEWLPSDSLFVRQACQRPLKVSPFADRVGHMEWVKKVQK